MGRECPPDRAGGESELPVALVPVGGYDVPAHGVHPRAEVHISLEHPPIPAEVGHQALLAPFSGPCDRHHRGGAIHASLNWRTSRRGGSAKRSPWAGRVRTRKGCAPGGAALPTTARATVSTSAPTARPIRTRLWSTAADTTRQDRRRVSRRPGTKGVAVGTPTCYLRDQMPMTVTRAKSGFPSVKGMRGGFDPVS